MIIIEMQPCENCGKLIMPLLTVDGEPYCNFKCYAEKQEKRSHAKSEWEKLEQRFDQQFVGDDDHADEHIDRGGFHD